MARRRGKIVVAGGMLEKALGLPQGLHIAAIEPCRPGFIYLVLDGPQMPEQVTSEPEVLRAQTHHLPPPRPKKGEKPKPPVVVWTFTPTRIQVLGGLNYSQ